VENESHKPPVAHEMLKPVTQKIAMVMVVTEEIEWMEVVRVTVMYVDFVVALAEWTEEWTGAIVLIGVVVWADLSTDEEEVGIDVLGGFTSEETKIVSWSFSFLCNSNSNIRIRTEEEEQLQNLPTLQIKHIYH